MQLDAVRVKPNLTLLVLAAVMIASAPVLFIVGAITQHWGLALVGSMIGLVGPSPWRYVVENNVEARREPVRLLVTRSGIRVGDEPMLARRDIREAYLAPTQWKPIMRVMGYGRALARLELQVETWGQGRELLTELGLDAPQAPARFTGLGSVDWILRECVATGAVAGLALLPMWWHRSPTAQQAHLAVIAAVVAAVWNGLLPPRPVVVRPDGLLLDQFGRTRFVPFSDVVAVDGGALLLRSKARVALGFVAGTRVPKGERIDDALTRRVIDAFRAHCEQTSPAAAPLPSGVPKTLTVLHTRTRFALAACAVAAATTALLLCRTYGVAVVVAATVSAIAVCAWTALRPYSRERADVTSRGDVVLIGHYWVERDRFANAFVQPDSPHPTVILTGRDRRDSLKLSVPDASAATTLLRVLHLDPANAVANYTIRSGLIKNTTMQMLFLLAYPNCLGALRHHGFFRWLIVVLGAMELLNRAWPTCIRVGADGLLVSPLIGPKRFFPIASIRRAEAIPRGIALFLASGRVDLETGLLAGMDVSKRDAIVDRLRQCIELAGDHKRDVPQTLKRRGTLLQDWLTALRAMRGSVDGYRIPMIAPDRLWSVVEDARIDMETRTAAAVALHIGDADMPRLRTALDTSASPMLGEAFTAAIRQDDARLEAALEEAQRVTVA